MVGWMATWYFRGFAGIRMAERDNSANACQRTCVVSRTWQRRPIRIEVPSRTWETWKCSPQCTSSTKGGAIVSPSWQCSSIEVVSNQLFCRSCGYIPHVCRNGQWWIDRNSAQIPGFAQSLCICNDTQSGLGQTKSYCTKASSNYSEVLGIERAVAGISPVAQLRQIRVPNKRLHNKGPGGYDNCASDLHQHSGVAQMWVLHCMMSQPNITMLMIHWILESLRTIRSGWQRMETTFNQMSYYLGLLRTLHQGMIL